MYVQRHQAFPANTELVTASGGEGTTVAVEKEQCHEEGISRRVLLMG